MKLPRTQKIQIYEYIFDLTLEDKAEGNRVISSTFQIEGKLSALLTKKELKIGQVYQERLHAGGFDWLLIKERDIVLPTHNIIISVCNVQFNGTVCRFGGGKIVSENLKEVCNHCGDHTCNFDCPDAFEWASDRDQDRCIENNQKLANSRHFNYVCDAILSIVLAHAVAGIKIDSPAYIEGLETAIDAIGNHDLFPE